MEELIKRHYNRGVYAAVMINLGPVSDAVHGGKASPWFSLAIGICVLVATWTKYFKHELRETIHIGIVIGISAICGVFIATGIWGLLH